MVLEGLQVEDMGEAEEGFRDLDLAHSIRKAMLSKNMYVFMTPFWLLHVNDFGCSQRVDLELSKEGKLGPTFGRDEGRYICAWCEEIGSYSFLLHELSSKVRFFSPTVGIVKLIMNQFLSRRTKSNPVVWSVAMLFVFLTKTYSAL